MTIVKRYVCAALVGLSWMCFAADVSSVYAIEDEESQTIRAMLDAGLRQVAVDYIEARRRLAADDLDTETRWVVRLSEFYAQSALRGASRDDWQDSIEILEAFTVAHSANRRQPWLEWQRARCDFLRAQSELAAHLAAPTNTSRRDTVLQLVRDVLHRLDTLDRDIIARRQVAARQRGSEGSEASVKQLNQLQVDASLLACEAVWLRAQLYPPESKDRIAAATLLTVTAADVLIKTDGKWPSRPQLEIANAAGQLQLSSAREGLQTLRRLALEAPTPQLRSSAAQLAVEYLCRQADVSQARSMLSSITENTPQRLLAELQVGLADLDNTSGGTRETALQQAVQSANELRLRFGEYWGNRGEALLVGSGATSGSQDAGGTALDLLRVEVKQMIAAGQVQAAIGKLEGRLEIETAAENAAAALELASQTAALLHQQGDSSEAARVLSRTAVSFRSEDESAKQHQLALAYMQQALRAGATKELFESYESALRLQLATWPASEDSVLPSEWLAVWLVGQKREIELLRVLWDKSTAGNLASATGDMVRWLDAFSASGTQREILSKLEAWPRSDASPIAELQSAVVAVAKLLSSWQTDEVRSSLLRDSVSLSRAAPAGVSPADWQRLAAVHQGVLCLEAVRGNKLVSAESLARNWKRSSMTADMLRAVGVEMVDAIDLTQLDQHSKWSQTLGIDQSFANVMLEARSSRAQAVGYRMLGWIDGPSASIEGLENLRAKVPSDATVLLQLCRALAESGENRLVDSSRWAKVVIKNTPPTSDVHLFARWRWLANLQLSGESQKAAAESKYFLAVSPPQDPIWKERFAILAN